MYEYGIWCGKDATVAAIDDFNIAFLRIEKDKIACILKHNNYGTVGAVYGLGINKHASAVYCNKNPETGIKHFNNKAGADNLENHSADTFLIKENGDMIYTMYDGKSFDLCLAEEINMADFDVKNPVDKSFPIAKRMAQWGVDKFFEYNEGCFEVGIDTENIPYTIV